MESLLIISLFAGILTVLSPCVLPILPVIIGGSVGERDWWRPLVIILSLSISIIAFTLLLKFASVFVNISQQTWFSISGGLLIILGLAMVFPELWTWFTNKTGIENSQQFIQKADQKQGILRDVLLGAALGPVFSSCSPTYFLILAVVLPSDFAMGIFYLVVYSIGLAIALGVVAYGGRAIFQKMKLASNPKSWFKRILGAIILLTGLAIITGYEKKLENYLLEEGLFNITQYEQSILDNALEDNSKKAQPDSDEMFGSNADLFEYNYSAPEFEGLGEWINAEGYDSIEELEGKVVLIDFWTYSCINCIRTLPYLQSWHEKYADDGFVLIGIHAPEFQFEKKLENVRKAAEKYGLTYPIVQDNDFQTWRNYNNRYRPAKYLIDKDGNVRYQHFGEGDYEETEDAIVALLKQIPGNENLQEESGEVEVEDNEYTRNKTAETYLGTKRSIRYPEGREAYLINASDENDDGGDGTDQGISYSAQAFPSESHVWSLDGRWTREEEYIENMSEQSELRLQFYAREVNLVMSADEPIDVEVLIDGELTKTLTVTSDDLYNLFESDDANRHTVTLIPQTPGVEMYAFTFG